ncbi:hypothetical protein N2152v2_010993 [Parachlorella kessleri]
MQRLRALRALQSRVQPACTLRGYAAAAEPAAAPAPPPDTIEVTVDGQKVTIPKGSNVIQACDAAGVDIPRFCYHERLSIAGNCRMCLVEVEKSPKPVASCAMPAAPNMVIKTSTPLVKKAREGVMEFLLINHPLDCPICDQGGECDLQDQSLVFGSDRGRFTEVKRAVGDKNLGPLVKTVMTRCIHCTRCVRFAKEVAGIEDLGTCGRGRDTEIGTYVERVMTSELSGNVIDLCPVGALTSKPAAFTYRPWELKPTESIDVSDGMGANIKVDSRGVEVLRIAPRLNEAVLRITPRLNEAVNQEWISDKARFQFDALRYQRLAVPMVKKPGKKNEDQALDNASWREDQIHKQGDGLDNASWREALEAIRAAVKGVKGNEMRAIAGRLADAESLVLLKDLFNRLGSGDLRSEAGFADLDADIRSTYLFGSTISGIDQADAILLIGTNPRTESPVLNARIRAAVLAGTSVGVVGEAVDLTYPYTHLGEGAGALDKMVKGSEALEVLKNSKRPMVIVGPGVLQRPDRAALQQKASVAHTASPPHRPAVLRCAPLHLVLGPPSQVNELVGKAEIVRDGWNGFNVLHDSASRVAALDLGFLPSARARTAGKPKLVYLLGADEFSEEDVPADAFVIYQGHHGDRGAARADVILPGPAFTEKFGTFVNFEGRVQTTKTAVPTLGDARDDWKILRALSEVLGVSLPVESHADVKRRLADVAPHLGRLDAVEQPLWLSPEYYKAVGGSKAAASKEPLRSSITQFYMTDVISRASKIMAKCVRTRQETQPDGLNQSAQASVGI